MMTYIENAEILRLSYKPEKIKVLFVGEAVPSDNTFFYAANSPLYKYTREAFEAVFKGMEFTLDVFKEKGCYLFDLAGPVGNMTYKGRITTIAEGIPVLAKIIMEEKPQYIISTKNANISAIVLANEKAGDLIPDGNIFDMPAPVFGSHHYYKSKMVKALKQIYGV
jgi:hypothetical protein